MSKRAAWIQAVDHIAVRGVRVSMHCTDDTVLYMDLDEQNWADFRNGGDDALAIATGRAPKRAPDDPSYFQGVPTNE